MNFIDLLPELRKYADRLHKRNVSTDDLISDLYIYLNDNPNKVNKDDLKSFCKAFLYNSNYYAQVDIKNKYNNSRFKDVNEVHGLSHPPEEEVFSEEQDKKLKAISQALENMDSDTLEMYNLYFKSNYTIREIAEILGRSVGDIHSRVKEMRAFIKTYYNRNYQTRIQCQTISHIKLQRLNKLSNQIKDSIQQNILIHGLN